MFEAQGNRAFVAFFMYAEATGMPIWYAAYGDFLPGAVAGEFAFTGDLRVYKAGQGVSSAVYRSPTSTSVGPVGITFAGGRARVALPGGRTIDAQRYVIDGSGFDFANPVNPLPYQPEVGWFWNPAEGGRGYAIEVQNGKVFMAMFHYNPDGSPTWNVVQGDITTGTTLQAFELYSGGQSLTSGYRGPIKDKLSPFTLSFRNPCAGQMQLAGAPAIQVRRFRIDGTSRASGAECNAVSNRVFPATPGLRADGIVMEPGDSAFGKVEVAGELYAYGFNLQAGKTYTATLEGAATGAGTLPNPVLSVYDANLVEQAAARQSPSSFRFTPGSSGVYYFTAKGSGAETGYFLLSVSGIASTLASEPPPFLGLNGGAISGTLSGRVTGTFNLDINNTGQATGSLFLTGNPFVGLAITGQVAPGGAIQLIASGGGNSLTFSGFMSPDGVLFGTWSDGQGVGGMFRGHRTSSPPPTVNTAPTAVAGPSQNVTVGATVMLNGSSSSDPQNDALTYSWAFVSRPAGSVATLSQASSVRPSFVADVAGNFVVRLIVNDGQLSSAQSLTTITATAPTPTPTSTSCNLPDFQASLLARVNQYRVAGASCRSAGQFAPALPLSWNGQLQQAAAGHSIDMATRNYFSHTSLDGRTMADRVNATGYPWRNLGENIAAGYPTVSAVVDGWMASDGHCANIMNPAFQQVGVACVPSSTSTYSSYWTMNLGRPF